MSKVVTFILTTINIAVLALALHLFIIFRHSGSTSGKLVFIDYSDMWYVVNEKQAMVAAVIFAIPVIIYFLEKGNRVRIFNFLIAIISIIVLSQVDTSI